MKEKVDQEKRTEDDIAKGIVKWLVDVYDETGETVAVATILTMVKKKNQDWGLQQKNCRKKSPLLQGALYLYC